MNLLPEEEHERRLKIFHEAVKDDISFKEFAERLGLNYAAAYRWCRHNDLSVGRAGKRSNLTVSDEQFIQVYSRTENPIEIQEKLGIDKGAYYYRCHKLGLMPKKYPNRRYTPWRRDKNPPKNEYTEEAKFFEREMIKYNAQGTVVTFEEVGKLMKEINKMNRKAGKTANGQS
jgi:transposase